jgi:hypothetical protein
MMGGAGSGGAGEAPRAPRDETQDEFFAAAAVKRDRGMLRGRRVGAWGCVAVGCRWAGGTHRGRGASWVATGEGKREREGVLRVLRVLGWRPRWV